MASRIQGITVEIGGDTAKLQTALKGVNGEIKNTQAQLKDVERLLKLDPGNTELLAQKQKLLSDAVRETKEKLETLKTAAEQANTALENGDISQEQYDALQREIIETEQDLKKLEAAAKESSVALQSIADKGEKLKTVGSNISSVGTVLTKGVTAPIVAAGAASVAAFNEVDKGLDIVTTKTGATGEALKGLQTSMKNVYGSMAVTAEEAGTAVGEVNTRFGLTGKTLETVSAQFLKFASINGTDVNTAIDSVDAIMKKFGVDTEQTGNVLGLMTKAGQDTGISMETLESALTTNGASLKEMGLGLTESVNLLAQMEASGVDTSTAMAGLKKAVVNATKQGLSADEALKQTIGSIKNASSETEALSIATELFGSKGAAEMTQAIREGRFSIDDLSASLSDYGDVVDTTYGNTQDATDQAKIAMNNLKLAGTELATSMFTAVAPALQSIVQGLQKAVNWFSHLDEGTKQTIVKIAALAATIGPVLVIIGKIVSVVGTVMTIVPKIASAIKVVQGAMAMLNTTMLANPIFLIIAAIAALVAAFIYLWNNCDGFRQFWIDLWENVKQIAIAVWNAIKEFFSAVWEAIKGILTMVFNVIKTIVTTYFNIYKTIIETVLNVIKTVVTNVWNTIKTVVTTVMNAIKTVFSTIWDAIKTIIGAVVSGIKALIKGDFEGVKNSISTIMNTIKNTISTIWNTIKSTISTVLGAIKNCVSNIFNGIVNAIKGAMTNVLNAVKNGFSNVKSHITGLASQAVTWGKDLVMGIVNGIKSCIGAVGDAVKSVADKIKSFLHFSVPDEGPLTDYESWMPDFMGGLAKGIEKSRGMIKDAVSDVAGDMVVNPNVSAQSIQGRQETQTDILTGILSGIREVMGSMQTAQAVGNISIPVYIGGNLIDEVVVTAQNRMNLRSGGR